LAPPDTAQVIYQYILDRKGDIEREVKAWEAQQAAEAAETAGQQQQEHDSRIEEFVARQEGLSRSDLASRQPGGAMKKGEKKGAVGGAMGRTLVNDTGTHAPDICFWVPQLTPQVRILRGQSRIRYSLPPPGFSESDIHLASATGNPPWIPLDSRTGIHKMGQKGSRFGISFFAARIAQVG